MTDSVENWESIIHKTVRAKDGHLIGGVDAVDETAVLISTEGARTHYSRTHRRKFRWWRSYLKYTFYKIRTI